MKYGIETNSLDQVNQFDVSPGGDLIVCASSHGKLSVHEASTGKMMVAEIDRCLTSCTSIDVLQCPL